MGQNKLTTCLAQYTILDHLLIDNTEFYPHMIFNLSWIMPYLTPKLYRLSYYLYSGRWGHESHEDLEPQ